MALDETTQALEPAFPLAGQVASALEGAVYPLTRRELVLVARANEAPRTLLSLLEGLPDAGYRSLEDVQVTLTPPPLPPAPGPGPASGPAPARDGRPPASR